MDGAFAKTPLEELPLTYIKGNSEACRREPHMRGGIISSRKRGSRVYLISHLLRLADRGHDDCRAADAAAGGIVGVAKIGVVAQPKRVNLGNRCNHDCRAAEETAKGLVEIPAIDVLATAHGGHLRVVKLLAERKVFNHERHGKTPKDTVGG